MPKVFVKAKSSTIKKTLAIYKEEIAKDKREFIAYAVCVPINRLLYLVILPLLFSLVIQSLVTQPSNWQYPTILLAGGVIASAASLVAAQIGFKKLFVHQEQLRTRLLMRSMQSLMDHSDQFFAARKVGSLAGDVTTMSNSIVTFLDIIFLQASGLIVNFVLSLVIIAIMSPVLLIPLTLATFFLVWQSAVATAKRAPFRHKRKELTSQLNGNVADVLGNLPIVRYFAMGNRELGTITTERHIIEKSALIEVDIIQREAMLRQGLLFAFQIITMAACVWLFSNGSITIAALIFAVTYLGRLTSSLFDISPIIRGLEQVFLDAAPITEIIHDKPEITDTKKASKLTVAKGAIELTNVGFAYSDATDSNVISDISLSIKPGERIGLAGPSGGGKTTFTKLLLRFADVTEGAIAIDEQNISKVTQASLRSAIAYVPQEPYLFHRSLRDNIAYARPNATDEEIYTAVKQANAYEFIKDLPDGLSTVVGERGVKLSGGQRQRIAIARAILKDAPILILDEATSALDSESEKLIQEALEKLMKGRTSIVVAHRLSTISKLDRIVVLRGGKIAEQGSHNALLKQKGLYARLWSHQSGGFIEE